MTTTTTDTPANLAVSRLAGMAARRLPTATAETATDPTGTEPTGTTVAATDFCLVTMPYARLELSSVALGLLQAILKRDGISARSVYANLQFADRIGLDAYGRVSLFRPRFAVADWTFAHVAFPGFQPDEDAYVELVCNLHAVYEPLREDRFRALLHHVRAAAAPFVDELAASIVASQPRIVGCSSTFCQHVPSLALLRRIRELAPDVVTMMGGAHCETVMGRSTHALFPWVDYVVSGEADDLLAPLTRAILEHGRDVPAAKLPAGVFAPAHRRLGYPVQACHGPDNAPRAVCHSLEGQPVPDFDDFMAAIRESETLRDRIAPGLSVESSRGCWWGQKKACTFCGFNGKGVAFRSKSSERFGEELKTLCERYGVNAIETVDNILDMGYMKSLFPALRDEGRPYRLYYEIKSNLQRHHIQTMREAGVIWVQTGIESLHTEMLKLMSKGCTAVQNIQLLKWLREFGIRVHWNILYDFPGDSDAWYAEMLAFMPLLGHLQPPIKVAPLEFCRYSVYHENPERFGLRLHPSAPYAWVYPVGPEDLTDLVYFFEDEERARLESNPFAALLTEREVFTELHRAHQRWLAGFWQGNAILTMTVAPDHLAIVDTRPVAVARTHRLEGLRKDVYLAADDAPRTGNLVRDFVAAGFPEEAVRAECRALLDARLAVEIDGRLLALAVRAPMAPLPMLTDYPGGVILARPKRVPDQANTPCRNHSPSSLP